MRPRRGVRTLRQGRWIALPARRRRNTFEPSHFAPWPRPERPDVVDPLPTRPARDCAACGARDVPIAERGGLYGHNVPGTTSACTFVVVHAGGPDGMCSTCDTGVWVQSNGQVRHLDRRRDDHEAVLGG